MANPAVVGDDWTPTICRVHELMEKDPSIGKAIRDCKFCSKCDSWICRDCREMPWWKQWGWRAVAALKHRFGVA